MAYTNPNAMQVGEGNTGQFNIACLNRVERMCNRREDGDLEKYYVACRYALFFVISGLTKEKREAILADMRTLDQELQRIYDTEKNEASRKEKMLAVQVNFAETHEFYIFEAFSRIGILHVSDEGVLDFDKRDINQLTSLVRAGAGAARFEKASKDGVASELSKPE